MVLEVEWWFILSLFENSIRSSDIAHRQSYFNSISIIIPLTPDCPLPDFYALPHQALQKLMLLVAEFGITKLPEQDEYISDDRFRERLMTTPGLLGHLYQIDDECRRVRMQPRDLLIFHSFTHHAGIFPYRPYRLSNLSYLFLVPR